MAADHIAHVKLRELIICEVRCFVTLPQKFGLNSRGIIAASDAQAYKYIGFFPFVEAGIEFGDDTAAPRRPKLTQRSRLFRERYSEQFLSRPTEPAPPSAESHLGQTPRCA